MVKLNESPLRTAKNFNINDIEVNDIDFNEKIDKFENVEILIDSFKDVIEENNNITELEYGLCNDFINQVNKNANVNLKLSISSKIDNACKIFFKFDKNNLKLIDNIEIIGKESTKSTVILKYESDKDLECYHNGVLRIKLENNAKMNLIFVNFLNNNSNNFISIENQLQENSKLNFQIVDFGGKTSVTNYYSNLIGDNSDNKLNAIYLGTENQVLDLNYISHLKGKKANINIEVQGALKDNAKKHFKGTIDFKTGCKKATGNENENCILLSDKAKSIALPMLLCSEEDVEGEHSTSAGKIDEKELFYLMTRGFTVKEAMKLIVRAKFNKILENIKDQELKEEILKEIDVKLN